MELYENFIKEERLIKASVQDFSKAVPVSRVLYIIVFFFSNNCWLKFLYNTPESLDGRNGDISNNRMGNQVG